MYQKVIIVTPVYKKEISKEELLSIKLSNKYLKNYKKVIVAPKKFLNDKEFNIIWKDFGYDIIYFDNKHFKNVLTYNKFMMSIDFYKEFINYHYILMCQLDVLILSDAVEYWVSKEFDYIGAPFVDKNEFGLKIRNGGNGGFSLRRVKSFLTVLKAKQFHYTHNKFNKVPSFTGVYDMLLIRLFARSGFFQKFISLFKYIYKGNEDHFWSFYAQFFIKEFIVASKKDSLAFAFEQHPEFCYEQNNFNLPFGVHAWEKYNPDFWKQKVPELLDSMKEDTLESK